MFRRGDISQMGFSGIVSFEVTGSRKCAPVLAGLHIFMIAESLGGVKSPAVMTHASIPKPERKTAGLDDGLILLSVGLSTCRIFLRT
jgi:cystathionine beta-lyase